MEDKLNALWGKIVDKRKEYDEATHELVMAYANHKSGESYERCDNAVQKCDAIGRQYDALREEYNNLCGEISIK